MNPSFIKVTMFSTQRGVCNIYSKLIDLMKLTKKLGKPLHSLKLLQ